MSAMFAGNARQVIPAEGKECAIVVSDGEGRVTELPFASARGLVAAHGPLAPSTGVAAAARAIGSAPVALVAAAAAATQGPPPPGGLAPAPAAPHVSPPPLDRLLRFTGDAAGSAKEEAAFLLYGTRTHRALRVTFLTFLCIAYGAYALVGLSDALTKAEGFSALYFIRVGQCVACLFFVAAFAGSERAWLVTSAVYASVLTNVFGTWYFAAQAPGVQIDSIVLFGAMPLICGVAFRPEWRAYSVICTVHIVRSIVELQGLGATTIFVVCFASSLGAVACYVHERDSREHFVSGRARSRQCCRATVFVGLLTRVRVARAARAGAGRGTI
jgi:hypothetical protein